MLHSYPHPTTATPHLRPVAAGLLLAAALGLSSGAQAQTWESAALLTSTGFNFRGASAARESMINVRSNSSNGYTNNPYGALPGVAYGAALQQQRVTRGKVLFGLQAGYERLRSRVNNVLVWSGGDVLEEARGHTNLIHDFVNVHPYAGRRFGLGPLSLDAAAGLDLGLLLHCQEKGFATTSAQRFTTDLERGQPGLDTRLRLDLTGYYHRVGLAASYSHGLTNYRSGWVGGANEAYSQVWRLGVVYRLF
ncbi:hypothetical protein LJ737_09440 [Hymenobacter sp. 15J16-1T3B]|uniref:hypothetical protein n=1 Tax=Hymenobacter sp. 15J16-1T3B TaxID=2886941 RepID=UPI001D0FEE72|nr:hypothetical protein [Hymenobacter sp. 15J16-1T3B]MCC3157462.1 hypothetical protein [Hymenobacter sp. 15J16-1T3B]